jgi:hypothetical protein
MHRCPRPLLWLPSPLTLISHMHIVVINMEIENDDNIEEMDANIQYGYRRSRWSTLYVYPGSSSLTPTQIMEQETYYRYAEVAVQRVTYILQLILLHQASYVSLRALISHWSGVASMERTVAIARESIEKNHGRGESAVFCCEVDTSTQGSSLALCRGSNCLCSKKASVSANSI